MRAAIARVLAVHERVEGFAVAAVRVREAELQRLRNLYDDHEKAGSLE